VTRTTGLGAFAVFATWCFGSCTPAEQVETLPLGLHQLTGCSLGVPSAIEVVALGDFPSRTVSVPVAAPSTAFESLPLETRELEVRARFGADGEAWGRQRVVQFGAALQPVMLLPEGRSCVLADDQAGAPDGASVAALPSGGLLVAGGRDSAGESQFDAKTLGPNRELVEPVPNGMLLRRADASATVLDGSVLIAGGAAETVGRAQETFEVFDLASGRFDGARSGKLLGPRMSHAALRLPDGRVLLAGGRAEPDGPPLATAELLELTGADWSASAVASELVRARASPQLLLLDSGSVLVLAGSDAQATVVETVERFDAASKRFAALPVTLPVHAQAVAVTLPGARVAWLACDSGMQAQCELSLLLERDSALVREDVTLPFAELAPAGLADLRLVALADGQLLLTASDPSDARVRRRAFVIDLDVPSMTSADASRVPSQLIALRTGAIAELDAVGASLRAQPLVSQYDSPSGDLLAGGSASLTQDAPDHWSREDAGLRALSDGARVDVPELRFLAVRVELDSTGELSLLLGEVNGHVEVALADGLVSAPGCSHRLPDGARLVVTRDRTQLTLTTDEGAALCQLSAPDGPLGVALRAQTGALIRGLTLERGPLVR
jgi:hypothetical protein